MNAKKILLYLPVAFVAFGLSSCLDYDEPGDNFNSTTHTIDDVVYHGKADSIPVEACKTLANLNTAMNNISDPFDAFHGGVYGMRGGKDGGTPVEHAYQYVFTNSVDGWSQWGMIPHQDFAYGDDKLSCYHTAYNAGPWSGFISVKNGAVPLLNHPDIDSIPEIKAIALLFFDFAAIETVDMYGAMPFLDYKSNKQESPFTYNDLFTIYVNVEANIDTIVARLKNYDSRPDWYQEKVDQLLLNRFPFWSPTAYQAQKMDLLIRMANSLKLRMAMHLTRIIQVDEDLQRIAIDYDDGVCRKWAEEAIRDGVVETYEQEIKVDPVIDVNFNPLNQIMNVWNDQRISASLESLMTSLNHPYLTYFIDKNFADILNEQTGDILEKGTRNCGIRDGERTGFGQALGGNPYVAFSRFSTSGDIDHPSIIGSEFPFYIVKLSEVEFLRAEGAVRGWDMGGTAQEFYEAGIRHASLFRHESPDVNYDALVDAYLAQTEPTPFTWTDPLGYADDMESVTKIGVAWDEADDNETKLEKIITQKYLALFPTSPEMYTELRRTGYPKLFPVLNPEDGDGSLHYGDIIRRPIFPGSSDADIRDIEETGIKALGGPDKQATRLWWDPASVTNNFPNY